MTEPLTKEEHEKLCSQNTNSLITSINELKAALAKMEGNINSRLTDAAGEVEKIHKRLFMDNGTKSIQSVLNYHESQISALRGDLDRLTNTMRWLARTVIGAIIVMTVTLVFTQRHNNSANEKQRIIYVTPESVQSLNR